MHAIASSLGFSYVSLIYKHIKESEMKKTYIILAASMISGVMLSNTALGCKGPEEERKPHMPPHVFKHMDSNHDAVVSKEEALVFIEKQFTALDKDSNSQVTRDEARNGFKGRGRKERREYKED